MEDIIKIENLSFSYGANKENTINGDFAISKGEIVYITGKSGSGKSTLLGILNGVIPEVIEGELSGDIYIKGEKNPHIHKRSLTIGNVFQNPRSQFFTTNTTAELVFAMENLGLPKVEMEKRLADIAMKFNIKKLLNRDIFDLSSGERQLLALTSSLIMNPDIVIFDEPSANLDYGNIMALRKKIINLRDEGKTILIADHRCFYLENIMDKVILTENNGVTIYRSEEDFKKSNYGKRLFNLFNYIYQERAVNKSENKDVVLSNISYKNILEDINITFNSGEVAVIVGLNGAGKTTLAKIISKLISPDGGYIDVRGQPLYIMQDPDFQLFGASVIEELRITSKDDNQNNQALIDMGLYDLRNKHPQQLSGGEKQRLQMAISLVSNNKVIIMDEPTSGLDKDSMENVINFINAMKVNRSLIIISHDYEFIRKVADKIVYLKDKKVEEEFYLEKSNIEKLNEIYKDMEVYYEKQFED